MPSVQLMWVIQGFVERPVALFDVRISPIQTSICGFKGWLSTQQRIPATVQIKCLRTELLK